MSKPETPGDDVFGLNDDYKPANLKIKLPAKPMVTTRGAARHSDAGSGSQYTASEKSMNLGDEDAEGEEEEPEEEMVVSGRGRAHKKVSYVESQSEEELVSPPTRTTGFGRRSTPDPTVNTLAVKELGRFVEEDEDAAMHEEHDDGSNRRRLTRLRSGARNTRQSTRHAISKKPASSNASGRQTRSRARQRQSSQDHDYEEDRGGSSNSGEDADGSLVEDDLDLALEPEPEPEPEDDNDGKPYALRQRAKINYAIPPPIEEMTRPPPKPASRNTNRGGPKGRRGLGWSASGAELGRWMGMPGDDSDSDNPTRTPRKPFGVAPFGAGAMPAGGMMPGDLAAGGTPSNLGKIGDAALADADPLGVNQNVTFDEVGGLDDRDDTAPPSLPRSVPTVQRDPTRGVLFHGPPGTGKTLLARALAASSRSGGRRISFFMRKGADCLSKWVGEAERQLRLLFEEARNSQPSIIFFDEIDGLAPVRSSKQDQIHASIVSTLLALMDGMDGRGQVIVIGATNRPDAVDPALRRPGRFDREFYFGLPGLEAREKILGIMTKKWENWNPEEEGEKGEQVRERLKGLARMTKGYGGADLRALCTEAALNAIQRRYPQVYKSTDRLLLKPETINVTLRDFMISIKKIVPSSARSSTSAATPLPPQFEPLLSETLEQAKDVIQRVMPVEKKLSALEEAEFEDGPEDTALEREMLAQSMQTLRVYRPRVVIHGPVGMGQGYIGAAALHHLEGYHVQSLELGTLLGDSTRTVESAIVQLFVEAKRHQPSVIYIPSLFGWCAAVTETSRSTVRAMLDTLLPTDPILLLAVVDGPFSALPKDVKAWFGPSRDNRVQIAPPSPEKRSAFFEPLLKDVARKPVEFADGVKRRKRILEELPIAPPLEPRKPSAAELALQEENDQKTMTILKFRLGPILQEMKRKFKRFTKRASEEYNFEPDENGVGYALEVNTTAGAAPPAQPHTNGVIDITGDAPATQPADQQEGPAVQQVMLQRPPLYDMDLDRMHSLLYKGHYLTPQSFLDDVGKMVHNADVRSHEDLDRLHKAQAMFTAAQVSLLEFDATFRMECERMAVREQQRMEAQNKDKGKGKEKGSRNASEERADGPQTRRSTRSNGFAAELVTMTDPVKLERRLKRQREAGEGSGAERDTSADADDGGLGVNGEPNSKRSKMVVDDEDDLNIRTPQSQRHLWRSQPFPIGKLPDSPSATSSPTHPSHSFNNGPPQQHFQQQPNHHIQPQPPHFNGQPPPQPHFYPPSGQMGTQNSYQQPRNHGFDPTLLNPTSPTREFAPGFHNAMHHTPHGHPQGMGMSPMPQANLFNQPGPSSHMQNYRQPEHAAYPQQQFQGPPQNWGEPRPQQHPQPLASPMPAMFNDPNDPFAAPPQPQQPQYSEVPQQSNHLQVPPEPSRVNRTPSPNRLQSILRNSKTPDPERRGTPNGVSVEQQLASNENASQQQETDEVTTEDTSNAMVVERSPSPPLPDFHLSEDLLQELRTKLTEKTGSLTIEQLEQLRATCLGEVWRQRKEWDRDPLVHALSKMVDEFLEEVKELEEWDEE
ncbi:hypothetical protein NMY22_g6683 [Coprinellus aureogranulatus]|nr:hypothetical protein NMY22_g6683 [Coprinellus aureogranulatus]